MQWKIISLQWLCTDLELTPREIYDVTWNPRIGGSVILEVNFYGDGVGVDSEKKY